MGQIPPVTGEGGSAHELLEANLVRRFFKLHLITWMESQTLTDGLRDCDSTLNSHPAYLHGRLLVKCIVDVLLPHR